MTDDQNGTPRLIDQARAAQARELHDAPITALLTKTMRREFTAYAAEQGIPASMLLRMMISSTLDQAKGRNR